MELINEVEFKRRLSEDKFIESPDELMEYRFPVIKYFKENYLQNIAFQIGVSMGIDNIKMEYDESKFTYYNRAFKAIKNIIK